MYCVNTQTLSRIQLYNPVDYNPPGLPLFMGFSRQEY